MKSGWKPVCHRKLRRIFPQLGDKLFFRYRNLSASNYSASEKPTYERSAVPKVLSSPVPLSSCLFLHHGACGLDGLETS